jgi:hypothetical protein
MVQDLKVPPPPTLEELKSRPIGRTGAELVLRLRQEGLYVDWDSVAKVYRVTDREGKPLLILGTDGPVHSALVLAALGARKGWAPPVKREGYTRYPAERLPHGVEIHAVAPNDAPGIIGQGRTEAAAYQDVARIREAVNGDPR